MAHDQAQAELRRAMALHAAGNIDEAIEAARSAIAIAPDDAAQAWSYLGNTLVTRKRRFADGIEALERAAALAPDDPWILYTLGWCREYAANALHRPKGGRAWKAEQRPAHDAPTLYVQAREAFLRALTLEPEDGLRGDIEDMLDVVANATGEPWRDEH